MIAKHLKPMVCMLNNGSHTLDPVSGIKIVDVVDKLISRRVNVTADDAPTFSPTSEILKLFLVTPHKSNSLLYLGFDQTT
jgi:hypothetical protein